MIEIKNRLTQYIALAAAIPAASASAGIVWSGPGQVGYATPGEPLLVDFGPGVGEVFQFSVRSSSFLSNTFGSRVSTTYSGGTVFYPAGSFDAFNRNALFQFNPANSGNVVDPRIVAPALNGYTSNNDPRGLSFGDPISAGNARYAMASGLSQTNQDLAFSSSKIGAYTTGNPYSGGFNYGDWAPGNRFYIGFNMQLNGADTFGWFDVEWHPHGGARGIATLIINGWGYNDTPRGPITAGEVPAPGAFGLAALAMGAAGVRRARRDRS